MARTKIICTIGPAVASLEKILALIDAGMNVARLNFSHGSYGDHQRSIEWLKEARSQRGVPLAIMLDTKGPEIRLGELEGGAIELREGELWLLTKEPCLGTRERATIDPPHLLDEVEVGMHLLFDDGYISTRIIDKRADGIQLLVENGGVVQSKKGINIPEAQLSLPAVTQRDIEDIRFGCQLDIDIVALSFVRSAQHIAEVRRLLLEAGKPSTLLIAKIENHEGVENFDSIVQVADGIMIARGDLGVELPLSKVPMLQKMMIRKCYLSGKVSITATQMLESMIRHPRPTRAEVSDVANAIYDGTSAVMLSGETAKGSYPIETVETMRRIAEETERDFDYANFFLHHSKLIYHDVPLSLTLASVKTASSAGAKCIIACTTEGATAQLVSRLRPSIPLLAVTTRVKSYHQMALYWGVTPLLASHLTSVQEAFETASAFALSKRYVSYGDLAVIIGASPFGTTDATNTLIVENIGNVLVRGYSGIGCRVSGQVMVILDPQLPIGSNLCDKIAVITHCDGHYEQLIERSMGVVLQNHMDDLESELALVEMAKHYQKSVLLRADNALKHLREGQIITLDPQKALIYKGMIP